MTSNSKKIRLFLLRWHRRIGAVIAIFLLLLSVTGLLLNHTDFFKLAQQPIRSSSVLNLYGIKSPEVISYSASKHWLSHLGGNYIYFDEQEVAYCQSPLRGVEFIQQAIVIACHDGLLLLTETGEVIERIDSSYGLPDNLESLATQQGKLQFQANQQWYWANLDQLLFTPLAEGETIGISSQPEKLPTHIHSALLTEFQGEEINWERFLLDLHSGRLFGLAGVIWNDLIAIALIWVAGTGVWVWARRNRR